MDKRGETMKGMLNLSIQAAITVLLASLCLITGCSDDTPPFSTVTDTGGNTPTDTGGNTPTDTGNNIPTDTGNNVPTDTGQTNTEYKLSGQIVPTGGFSMSNTYLLSGAISPGVAPSEQKSASYQLTMTP